MTSPASIPGLIDAAVAAFDADPDTSRFDVRGSIKTL
jgi:hypothetical protein